MTLDQVIEARLEQTELSGDERSRYSRHLLLPEVGELGQRRLKAARVLLIGAGGLGSPVGYYLAAAGVGTLGLVDFDVVDRTNLQRQIMHRDQDVGTAKLDSAKRALSELNPNIEILLHPVRISAENARSLIADYDIVVDGSDNFATRYLVNDCCVLEGKPNVYGSVFRFDGQCSLFYPPHGPCYRCLFPEPPPPGAMPNCAEGGVLGVIPGQIGLIQATEVIKLITGIGTTLIGRLLAFNARAMTFSEYKLGPDPNCPVCGTKPSIHEPIDYETFCGTGGTNEQPLPPNRQIDVHAYQSLRQSEQAPLLIDVRTEGERAVCSIEGSLHIPLADLQAGRFEDLAKDQPIVIHCKSGGRSSKAVKAMLAAGYTQVRNLEGGIRAWIKHIDPSLSDY